MGRTWPSAFCSSVTPQRRSTSPQVTPRDSHSLRRAGKVRLTSSSRSARMSRKVDETKTRTTRGAAEGLFIPGSLTSQRDCEVQPTDSPEAARSRCSQIRCDFFRPNDERSSELGYPVGRGPVKRVDWASAWPGERSPTRSPRPYKWHNRGVVSDRDQAAAPDRISQFAGALVVWPEKVAPNLRTSR